MNSRSEVKASAPYTYKANTENSNIVSSALGFFSHAKYDKQVILTLIDYQQDGCNEQMLSLAKKASKNGLESTIMSWKGNDFSAFKKLTAYSRIYIEGHGGIGDQKLHSEHRGKSGDMSKSPADFVNLLLEFAPQLKQLTSPYWRIKIGVVVCHGAEASADAESYCKVLSQALEKAGIYAVVHGYNGRVRMGRYQDGQNHYKTVKLVNDDYHPRHYKSIFVNGGEHYADDSVSWVGSLLGVSRRDSLSKP